MKVWEYFSGKKEFGGMNKDQIASILKKQGLCPGTYEFVHHLVGDRKMEKFCKFGCSVKCVDEYLDEVI